MDTLTETIKQKRSQDEFVEESNNMSLEKAQRLITQRVERQNQVIPNDAGSIFTLISPSLNVINLVVTFLTITMNDKILKPLWDLKRRMRVHEIFEKSRIDEESTGEAGET